MQCWSAGFSLRHCEPQCASVRVLRVTEAPAASASRLIHCLICFIVAVAFAPIESWAADAKFTHASAAESGAFNFGAAEASVSPKTEDSEQPALHLYYSVGKDGGAGIWTKNYPSELRSDSVDILSSSIHLPSEVQPSDIALKVEIKGTNAVQVIDLQPASGWSHVEAPIQWDRIGKLNEVVLVVTRVGDGESVSGTLQWKVEFFQLTFWDRQSASVVSRIAATALLAAILGLVCWSTGFSLRSLSGGGKQAEVCSPARRDFTFGLATVLVAGIALATFSLGSESFSGGWHCLLIALMGGLVGEVLKFGLTGKHLSPFELFLNVLVTGVLAATATSATILAVPVSAIEILRLCSFTSAVFVVLFHLASACQLASRGRHLSGIGGPVVLATPFVFSVLLTVGQVADVSEQNPILFQTLRNILIVFVFNEAIANGIGLAARRQLVKGLRAHLMLLAVAASVIIAPMIAAIGSGQTIAGWSTAPRIVIAILTTVVSQAGIWMEAYLLTGMLMDGIHGKPPAFKTVFAHCSSGLRKGMVYSGVFMTILHGLNLLVESAAGQWLFTNVPWLMAAAFGACLFPLAKTIIESFDGSTAFAQRVRKSHSEPWLYIRGAVVGAGGAWAFASDTFTAGTGHRALLGLIVGIIAYAGVSLLRDVVNQTRACGGVRSWRAYFIDALMGGFIGAALGFYLETAQVEVVVAKFHQYVSFGQEPTTYETWPFLNRWGMINLGTYAGGVSLLFKEALAGVLNWSIAAWLFAINRTFLSAALDRTTNPIKHLFTRAGFIDLIQHMIEVMRWGLWMSPIIFSFLRMMGEPTWYNQDGAIRTVFATFNSLTMSQEQFVEWSLSVFVALLAYDLVRILIWLDHMGLRVATLVNFSFLGMDKIDKAVARFIGRDANACYIPEGVKRFTTWGPLLIPFYIPMAANWDYVWNKSAEVRASSGGGLLAWLQSLSIGELALVTLAAVPACTLVFTSFRWLASRKKDDGDETLTLSFGAYEVVLRNNGECFSRLPQDGYDLTRRAYDHRHPCGRALFVVEDSASWPVLGNYPSERFSKSEITKVDSTLGITNTANDLETTIRISIPDQHDAVELWEVTVKNLADRSRSLQIVPYLEWVINNPAGDRGHTQYNRLFPELSYVADFNASLALHRYTKLHGFLASDVAPAGFLTSRMDFIGRAKSLWSPRALETLAFHEPKDSPACPSFDPISSLLVNLQVDAKGTATIRFLVGCAEKRQEAIGLIERNLAGVQASTCSAQEKQDEPCRLKPVLQPIRHGEILPGTPQPYYEFRDDGNTLRVLTPFTPRPYDHSMSNPLGHVLCVTNRGLHTSANGNSQQNRLTPDWADTVACELPGEVIYLFDVDDERWHSPTFEPLRDCDANYDVDYSVDGSATFRMSHSWLSTELTVFVPRTDPVGLYRLTIRNHSDSSRRLRFAPYFQIVLADMPENAGPLKIRHDNMTDSVYFQNPRNTFRPGVAFAAMTAAADHVETRRGRFLGKDAAIAHPKMVQTGTPANDESDRAPIAGFLSTLEVPADGEVTVAVMLGQADDHRQAEAVVRKFQSLDAVNAALNENRHWWTKLMSTSRVETSNPEFDQYQNWLKYQAIAERIWARRGFYQASGAFGFRDQLQDSVNMIWVDPTFARNQIKLHAAQQFLEGDVVHWFFRLQDGRTGFACRSHAYDNLLWLGWSVVEYVRMTGDDSLLDEVVPYLQAQLPLEPLPKGKEGMGFFPHRAATNESIYKHCLRAFDLVFDHRLGPNGLPLIGAGDWNDGLDEIGSEGRGESTWLGFFLCYIMRDFLDLIEQREGPTRRTHYERKRDALREALENTWQGDRYLRAIHDDGTKIGVKGSGVWEIDALTAAWSVMSGVNPSRSRICFDTAVAELERDNVVLLGHPALREDTKPFLGRSSRYPEGVRENGMYCHGDQWLVRAARILAEQCEQDGDAEAAAKYRATAYRLWHKISPLFHITPDEIEIYGGQPNKQAADMLTTFDPGRMIWNGYTGAAGWMHRQALEGVLGINLNNNEVVLPDDLDQPRGELKVRRFVRDLAQSPINGRETT